VFVDCIILDDTLKSLNGVRVMSMLAVMLGHTVMYYLFGDNSLFFLDFAINNWSFQLVIQAIYAVDTFFFLSGFLVAYLSLRVNKSNYISAPSYFIQRSLPSNST